MSAPERDMAELLHTVVGPTSVFRGDVEFTGVMRIEGSVIGNVSGMSGSGSRLWLDGAGSILGNVYVTDAVIEGRITGNVHCLGYLELGASASIVGDVHYAYLEMHLGASVNGLLVREPLCSGDGKVMALKSANQNQSSECIGSDG